MSLWMHPGDLGPAFSYAPGQCHLKNDDSFGSANSPQHEARSNWVRSTRSSLLLFDCENQAQSNLVVGLGFAQPVLLPAFRDPGYRLRGSGMTGKWVHSGSRPWATRLTAALTLPIL